MAQSSRDERSFWVGLGALLLVGIYLGVRTERGVSVVQSGPSNRAAAVAADPEGQAMKGLLTELDARSARILQAPANDRDPFREPAPKPVARTAPAPTQASAEPQPPPSLRVKPVLGALLYDEVNPSVQLRVGAVTSDWLHRGENFKDWTVVEIRPGAVTVSQDGDTVVLRPS